MSVMRADEVVVDVDYGQFYAMRAGGEWASDQVPSSGHEAHLWSDGSFVYVGTTRRYGETKVRVEVLTAPPSEDAPPEWQHVAEVSLDRGGALELHSWDGGTPAATVPVDPGSLRLRVCWRGLVPGRAEGVDDDGNSDEELLFQLWPAEPAPPAVTRWWEERALPAPTDVAPDGRRQTEGLEPVMERWATMTVVATLRHPYPPMPGGGEHAHVVSVLTDPSDDTWWVDGYDVRRTLREVSEEEAQHLLLHARPPDPS